MRVISLTIPVFKKTLTISIRGILLLSNDNRFQRFFEIYRDGKGTIGTWLTYEWLSEMSSCLGFDSCTLKVQPEYQIYSDFRFEVVIRL
jgi:hypothetical protein